jgi:hypothetical protein
MGTDIFDFSLELPQSGVVMQLFFREAARMLDWVPARPRRVGLDAEGAGRPRGKRQYPDQVRAIVTSRKARGAERIKKSRAKGDDHGRAPKRSYDASLSRLTQEAEACAPANPRLLPLEL